MLALIVSIFLATASDSWHDHYERGVRLIEQGQAAAARMELEAALAAHPSEGLQVATRPQQYIDYLPTST